MPQRKVASRREDKVPSRREGRNGRAGAHVAISCIEWLGALPSVVLCLCTATRARTYGHAPSGSTPAHCGGYRGW